MSFKIFTLKLTGKLKNTADLEKKFSFLESIYNECIKTENSTEFREYAELSKTVNSETFRKNKKATEALKFKGSSEEKLLGEFAKLKKNKALQNYFTLDGSAELKKFETIKSSALMAEFKELKASAGKISKEKAKRFSQLKTENDIVFYFNFLKSRKYRDFQYMANSATLKKYYQLKEKTESAEFLKRKAYLEDKKRWEKSDDAIKFRRFNELKAMPQIVNYLKYRDSRELDFFKQWEMGFYDNFSGKSIDGEKWSAVNPTAHKTIGENFALPGDIHLHTSGSNIETGGHLTIETRHEKTKGKMWQLPAGFIPIELNYSSGMVTTEGKAEFTDGIFEAKIKFNPVREVAGSVTLNSVNQKSSLILFESGTKNHVGISNITEKGKLNVNGMDISNLKKGEWYIFRLQKSGKSLSWKINGVEVLKLDASHIKEPLHFKAQNMVIYDIPASKMPVKLEIEWVKWFRRK